MRCVFGYLRPMKPEMKICEYQAYNAVYCGFCRAMGNSGALLRLTLSYDFTFFSVLALSLKEEFCGFDKCHCPAKCFAKKNCVKQSASLDYAADLAVLMLYGKLLDNISDKDGALKARLCMLYIKPKVKKISKRLPFEKQCIEKYLAEQKNAEDKGLGLDACADPTAKLLSLFFERLSDDKKQKEALNRLGYVLGRWIYLLDAADDYEDDKKRGRFNPLSEKDKEEIEFSLNVSISEAIDSINALTLRHFEPILKNIIYLGLENTQKAVLHCKDKKERKKALNGKSV